MRVLIGCEESQAVCIQMRKYGHEAFSADLDPCSGGHPEWHIQGDVLDILDDGWDMMIAHPECKYLCLSGATWFYDERYPNRMQDWENAVNFFQALQNAPIPKIAIENSQPLGRTIQRVGRYDQCLQPYHLGTARSKGTYWWLKNLPPIVTTHTKRDYDYIEQYSHNLGPSPDRSRLRAKTEPCIAEAMARQWGNGEIPPFKDGLFAGEK